MLEQVDVYYEGWDERWHWGSLVSSTAITGRPLIAFEYSDEALSRGLELSALRLPLQGPRLRRGFPEHQLGLPGPVYDSLPDGRAAFATKRFDRHMGMRIPMQSLAAFTGADFRVPGVLDYTGFLRATGLCTNDVREKALAFERVLFNVVFNNRDDHPKNFAYLMSATGRWALAPAYDVTFCEGPGGYHQMDVMGEALQITRRHLLALATGEAELSHQQAAALLDKVCQVASGFRAAAERLLPGRITADTLRMLEQRINENIHSLRQPLVPVR